MTPEYGQQGEGECGHVNYPLFKDVSPPDYLTFQFSFIECHCPILKKEKSRYHFVVLKRLIKRLKGSLKGFEVRKQPFLKILFQ